MRTVRFKVDFAAKKLARKLDGRRARPRAGRQRDEALRTSDPPAAPDPPTTAELHLAAAYALERKLATGELRGFRDAVDLIGGSEGWASQVLDLLNLKPEIQEAVLAGEAPSPRRLMTAARTPRWDRQENA